MNIRNLLLPNQNQEFLQSCIKNYCVQKTPVLIILYDKQGSHCDILYKMLKQNNVIDCLVIPCKCNIDEIKRVEKVIRRNFNNAFLILVKSNDCSMQTFGNVCLNLSPLHFISKDCKFESVGDACLTIFDNLVLKAPFVVNSTQKIQSLNIISAVYNIFCNAFSGD